MSENNFNSQEDTKQTQSEEKQTVIHDERQDKQAQRGQASDFWGTVRRIFSDIASYRTAVIVLLIASVGSVLFNIVGPRQLGRATTYLFEGVMARLNGTGTIDFDLIGRQLLFVLSLYLISGGFGWIQGWVTSTITQRYIYELRARLMDKIDRLPMSYFEARTYGEVLSRITNDIDTLGNGLSESVTTLIDSGITMLGILGIMLSMNVPMTLIALIVIPVSIGIVQYLMRSSQKYFRAQQYSLGNINGVVEESYAGQTIIQAYNQEQTTADQFRQENDELYESAWRSQFFSGTLFPMMNFVSQLGYIGVVISGAYFTIQGAISVGDIQAFTQYVNRFTQPITQLAQTFTQLQSMAAAGERVYEFLDESEESQEAGETLDLETVHGDVTFDHVRFGYEPGQIIIKDFSSDVQQGQKIALVGPTGAGKSTMVKLLMRFYDVNDGEIRLDGVPITNYSRESYRQAMGMVLQDTWLFHGTIMENLRYGRLDATDEEIYAAAKSARVDHFIRSLPGGYQFEINEEATNISQGQKQLLTIARAILADRPVLILDEATSSVDTRTEILIQEAMDELMQGRTSFVIAHRLSTIRDSDNILYMEDGDIVEQGNHDELMTLGGRYADLYNSQFSTE